MLAPSTVGAQELDWLRLQATGNAVLMTGGDQTGWLGFSAIGGGGAIGVGAAILKPLSLELRIAGHAFPAMPETGGLLEVGAGARLELEAPRGWLVWGPAVHVHLAFTGELVLPSIDVSFRAGIELGRGFSLGPEIGFGQVFWKDAPGYSTDARFVSLGLSLGWRGIEEDAPRERVRLVERRVERRTERRSERRIEVPVDRLRVERIAADPARDEAIDRLLDEAVPVIRREERSLIPPVLFEFDSTQMLPCGEVALHAAHDAIDATSDLVTIEGHADGTGTDDYNAELSRRRAEVVREWLVAHGIDADRLRVAAFGEHRRLVDETDDGRRQLNRRVIFRVVRTDDGTPSLDRAPFDPAPVCEPGAAATDAPALDASPEDAE
jgi:peptidoglycan-associated lipoprotein